MLNMILSNLSSIGVFDVQTALVEGTTDNQLMILVNGQGGDYKTVAERIEMVTPIVMSATFGDWFVFIIDNEGV